MLYLLNVARESLSGDVDGGGSLEVESSDFDIDGDGNELVDDVGDTGTVGDATDVVSADPTAERHPVDVATIPALISKQYSKRFVGRRLIQGFISTNPTRL